MKVQGWLIQHILAPLAGWMERFSPKAKDRVFILAGLGIFVQFFLISMGVIPYRYVVYYAIDCVFLGMMILCSIRSDIRPVKFRWPLAGCMLIVGLLMLQSGIRNNVDYLPEAMLLLVAYPVIYLCWNNCDSGKVMKLLSDTSRFSLIIFVLASFLLIKINRKIYGGILGNVNGCANYLSLASACLLADILYAKRFDKRCLGNVILLAITAVLAYYTASRSGMLSMICLAVFGVGIYLMTHRWAENWHRLVRLGVVGLVTVILMPSLVYVFQLRDFLPLPYYSIGEKTFYYSEKWNRENQDDPGNKTTEEEQTGKDKQEFFGIEGFVDYNDNKLSTSGKTLDRISTGRLTIWKAYAKHMNLFGHAENMKVYVEMLEKEINTTHMCILEIAYESGIIAGVFFFLLNIGTGIVSIWYAWTHREEKFAVLPLMVTVAFGVDSVLRSNNTSFWYMTTLYYYLVNFPIMAYLPKKDKPE